MRSTRTALICLLLAGCGSQQESESQGSQPKLDMAPGAPDVAVSAAPGVAFTYHYSFRLPAARIAAAQEAHAAACEKLGVARCRITGLRYTLTSDATIAASLAFKLDPTLARAFGRQGIAAIEAADGMLTDADITGVDAGAEIARIDAGRSRVIAERTRIERELDRRGLSAEARTELLRQRADLDAEARIAGSAVAEQRDTLARTPMTFDYESGKAIRGFDGQSPITQAIDTAIGSAQMTLAVALTSLAVLGPPALLLGLLFLLWRRVRHRFPKRHSPVEPS